MDNNNDENRFLYFCDDPQENLHIENQILQLKIKAELGGELVNHSALPPEVENEFLKNILAFEHAYADVRQVKLYDLLMRPPFKRLAELHDDEVTSALDEILAYMTENNVEVDFNGSYDDKVKYSFITEELFDHETDDIQMPGMTRHFIYEEFHPNHRLDIEQKAVDFLTDWFHQNIGDYSWEFGDQFILADGTIVSRKEVLQKVNNVFAAYKSFSDSWYAIKDINFTVDEGGAKGMGYAEGAVRYKGILENGEEVIIEGPFKFYMSLQSNWWTIFYFVFPGFRWD